MALHGTLLAAYNFSAARAIYENGANSRKASGLRTLKGFSVSISASKADAAPYVLARNYYGSASYAHDFVAAALEGSGDFANRSAVMRQECANKGAAYGNSWMYVVLELYDALDNCAEGDVAEAMQHWDEAWAFYAGSLEGPYGLGDGVQPYSLAEKRCANFATCTGPDRVSGTSKVNHQLLRLYQSGLALLAEGQCPAARAKAEAIVAQMAVPLVQGMLRYAWKADPRLSASGPKEVAEGWAFARGILPQVHACSPAAAALIRRNMDIAAAAPMVDGFRAVQSAVQSVYTCMNITCGDVGVLLNGTSYIAGCGDPLAGYYPQTDISEHARIDLDQYAFAARALPLRLFFSSFLILFSLSPLPSFAWPCKLFIDCNAGIASSTSLLSSPFAYLPNGAGMSMYTSLVPALRSSPPPPDPNNCPWGLLLTRPGGICGWGNYG